MSLVKSVLKKFSLDSAVYNYLQENRDSIITLSDEDIKKLQMCLLEILKDFDIFCNQNNLEYALTGGNVLGKVRHNGFIPWDDDVDVLMPRQDYDRLKKVFYESDICSKYTLKGPGCPNGADYRCVKIYKNDTVMRPVLAKKNAVNKVFIDVMPADYVPRNKIHRRLKSLHCYFLIFILGCCEFKKNTNVKLKNEIKKTISGKLNYYIRSILGSIFLMVPLDEWYNHFDRASVYEKETDYVTVMNGKLLYMGEIVPKDYYMPFHRCEYEGISTYMINRPEAYLKHRYGNYETIPKKEERESHCVEELRV